MKIENFNTYNRNINFKSLHPTYKTQKEYAKLIDGIYDSEDLRDFTIFFDVVLSGRPTIRNGKYNPNLVDVNLKIGEGIADFNRDEKNVIGLSTEKLIPDIDFKSNIENFLSQIRETMTNYLQKYYNQDSKQIFKQKIFRNIPGDRNSLSSLVTLRKYEDRIRRNFSDEEISKYTIGETAAVDSAVKKMFEHIGLKYDVEETPQKNIKTDHFIRNSFDKPEEHYNFPKQRELKATQEFWSKERILKNLNVLSENWETFSNSTRIENVERQLSALEEDIANGVPVKFLLEIYSLNEILSSIQKAREVKVSNIYNKIINMNKINFTNLSYMTDEILSLRLIKGALSSLFKMQDGKLGEDYNIMYSMLDSISEFNSKESTYMALNDALAFAPKDLAEIYFLPHNVVYDSPTLAPLSLLERLNVKNFQGDRMGSYIIEDFLDKIKYSPQDSEKAITLLSRMPKCVVNLDNRKNQIAFFYNQAEQIENIDIFNFGKLERILNTNTVYNSKGGILNYKYNFIAQIPDFIVTSKNQFGYENLLEQLKKFTFVDYDVIDKNGMSFLEKVFHSENEKLLELVVEKKFNYHPELEFAFSNIINQDFKKAARLIDIRFPRLELAINKRSKEMFKPLASEIASPLMQETEREYLYRSCKRLDDDFSEYAINVFDKILKKEC